MTDAVRVVLPHHLRQLAGVCGEVVVPVAPGPGAPTLDQLIDALEDAHPALRGTIRDPATGRRRPFLRFFVGEDDLSHERPDGPLPAPVAAGAQPFVVVGAIAGG